MTSRERVRRAIRCPVDIRKTEATAAMCRAFRRYGMYRAGSPA